MHCVIVACSVSLSPVAVKGFAQESQLVVLLLITSVVSV